MVFGNTCSDSGTKATPGQSPKGDAMMPTTLQIALFMCGLLGSALKSYVTQSQGTFSRRSVGDILTRGPVVLPERPPDNRLDKGGNKGIDSGTPKQGG